MSNLAKQKIKVQTRDSAVEAETSLEVQITGDNILDAYETLKNDLANFFTDNPDRRVEFAIGNISDQEWNMFGTAIYAGEWVRGCNPTEPLKQEWAIGAAVESDGGGAAAMLSFFREADAGNYYMFNLFGYCPKTADNRVVGKVWKVSADDFAVYTEKSAEYLEQWIEELEDAEPQAQNWTGGVDEVEIQAAYSGNDDGLVECTIKNK